MRTVVALVFGMLRAGAAVAQAPPPGQLAPGAPDRVLRTPYITGTGATVDKPGVPQGSGPTPLDRDIQHEDNAIDQSICKGCGK